MDTAVYKISNYEDLLCSTRNSTQYSVITYIGQESKKQWVYVYI